jgi:hypothetical protein
LNAAGHEELMQAGGYYAQLYEKQLSREGEIRVPPRVLNKAYNFF